MNSLSFLSNFILTFLFLLTYSSSYGQCGENGYYLDQNDTTVCLGDSLDLSVLLSSTFLNIPGNGVTELANCLNTNQEIGAIAAINLYENKSNIIREHGGTINKNDFSVNKHYLNQELNSTVPEMLEVDFVCGGNYMFRADVFNKIGK